MDANQLVHDGNNFRNSTQPDKALACYAQAFVLDPTNMHAWNNYGNTLREMGEPLRAIPFLQHAIALDPTDVTANFNLSVAYLLAGDLDKGFDQYEWRWKYEHLDGQLPQLVKPKWNGESLQNKTILITGEQGIGDQIQFARYIKNLHELGAKVIFQVTEGLGELFLTNPLLYQLITDIKHAQEYDYWLPVMSLGRMFKTVEHELGYVKAHPTLVNDWNNILGIKKQMRVGICWSGRKDSWLNQHKSIPVEKILELVNLNPDIEWINLQIQLSPEETAAIDNSPVKVFPGLIRHWADTAGLVHHLDMVISVDTAIAHLAGAMGKQLWIPLNKYAIDWRYLTNTNTSKWYPTARLFRQTQISDWNDVIQTMHKFLQKVKI